jgi:anti-anti-sigma regulatory factor
MPWKLEQGAVASRVTLTGHVDIFEAGTFHAMCVDLARRGADVHVDLSGCEDLDGSAIQILLALRRGRERHVALTGGTGRVARLLARFGLDDARAGWRQA